jgi:hypothetical protein
MATMRIPKYTAGMFKRKMPRFGASSIKMPRMPKPPKPRVKKYEEGGEVEEVVVSPEAYRKQESKDLVMRYLDTSKKSAEERKKIAEKILRGSKGSPQRNRPKSDKELTKEAIEEMMRNPPYKNMGRPLGTVKLNKGGSIDGCAIRGKTRGKIV